MHNYLTPKLAKCLAIQFKKTIDFQCFTLMAARVVALIFCSRNWISALKDDTSCDHTSCLKNQTSCRRRLWAVCSPSAWSRPRAGGRRSAWRTVSSCNPRNHKSHPWRSDYWLRLETGSCNPPDQMHWSSLESSRSSLGISGLWGHLWTFCFSSWCLRRSHLVSQQTGFPCEWWHVIMIAPHLLTWYRTHC